MSDETSPRWVPEWSLSDRLRKIRRDTHLSQEDFAHMLGVKASTFASWESGRNQPERILALAALIEEAFDVPAAWTLGLMDRPVRRTDTNEMPAVRPTRPRPHPHPGPVALALV